MKIARHTKILELIENKIIETQDELAQLLQEAGFTVTQATVSRDIRKLNLTKIAVGDGRQRYVAIGQIDSDISERLIRVFKEAVITVDHAQNVVVLKTLEGMGMAVGVAVDNMKNPEILGSIAGDDTVVCIIRSEEQAQQLVDKLYCVIRAE